MLCASSGLLSYLLMDRSASIQVAPEPLPVRRHRDPRYDRETLATTTYKTISVAKVAFNLDARARPTGDAERPKAILSGSTEALVPLN